MTEHIPVMRCPEGFIRWGRNAQFNGYQDHGPAQIYTGEAAEVIKLLLRHGAVTKAQNP